MEPDEQRAEDDKRNEESATDNNLAIGIAIGVSLGVGLGVAMDNIATGMGAGIAIGVAIGLAMSERDKRKEPNDEDASKPDES